MSEDVYKRQPQHFAVSVIVDSGGNQDRARDDASSFAHLDVYKRQGHVSTVVLRHFLFGDGASPRAK